METLEADEQRKAMELALGIISEYVYSGQYEIFNSLEPKEQATALVGLLNISGSLIYMISHAREDENIEETMAALSTAAYLGLEERIEMESHESD